MLLDKETVVFDTVDWSVTRQYIENIEYLLNGKELGLLSSTPYGTRSLVVQLKN